MKKESHSEKKNLSYWAAMWTEHILDIFEIVLAVTVLIAFALTFISLIRELPGLIREGAGGEAFHEFLEFALMLVVGIEFTKMLVKHTPGSVLEVLLFAIARHLVLNHDNGLENVLCIIAIAGIFAIRKFLHSESFETEEEGKKLDWLASPSSPDSGTQDETE
ncbi:MAG: hypothetical protein E7240_10790 [Lachnospiraceae bacterium]|nr:hypothetical protein [Lachnospiraceae bacterium]